MNRAFIARAFAALCLTCFSTAQAANLYNVTGASPFGFVNQHVMYMTWSQSVTYTNVSISVPLEDTSAGGPIAGTEGTMYLVTQIGPGTTAANNVAPPIPISGLTASFTTVQLWTGLTLPPGTYYLVFASANNNPMSMSPEGASGATLTPGVGVTPQQRSGLVDLNTVAAFPPASNFAPADQGFGNLFMNISGDTTGIPPPPPPPAPVAAPLVGVFGAAVMVLALLFGGLWRRRVD